MVQAKNKNLDFPRIARALQVHNLTKKLNMCILVMYWRDVAQLGRALRSGRRGRVFESRHSDFWKRTVKLHKMWLYGFLV